MPSTQSTEPCVIHTAGWRLGFERLDLDEAQNATLREARLSAVTALLEEAVRLQALAVVVAGDVFETATPSRDTWTSLVTCLQSTKTPVTLVPGLRDALVADSVWRDPSFRRALPSHVTVVEAPLRGVAVGDRAQLWAIPCRTPGRRPVLESPPSGSGVHLGILPGANESIPGFTRVLGAHVSPCPAGPDDVSAGSFSVIRLISRGAPRVETHAVPSVLRWERRDVTSLDALRTLANERATTRRALFVRVAFRTSLLELVEADRLITALRGRDFAAVLQLDRTHLSLDDARREVPDAWSSTVRDAAQRLWSLRDDPQQALAAERALVHLATLAATL